MDHHPVVLEQGVQPLAVDRRLAQHHEGVLAHQDEQQAEQGEGVDPHHRRLAAAGGPPHQQAEQGAPEEPDHEAPLLAGPEGGELVVPGQVHPRVLEDVLHPEVARHQQQQQHQGGEQDRQREEAVGPAGEDQRAAIP
jgi:hypothetical protein